MSASNGVIRVGRKGIKKFAVGEEEDPRALPVFEVDVVVAMQAWFKIDEGFRTEDATNDEGEAIKLIPTSDMKAYHEEAVGFVEGLGGEEYAGKLTTSEALDFIARLREQYDELVVFFRPRLREEPDSPDTSQVELRFSEEEPAQN